MALGDRPSRIFILILALEQRSSLKIKIKMAFETCPNAIFSADFRSLQDFGSLARQSHLRSGSATFRKRTAVKTKTGKKTSVLFPA